MLKHVGKLVAHYGFRPLLEKYLAKERTYRYEDISIRVLPGVFHPGFFFSTTFLLKFLLLQNLKKKTLLELGAGSGLISFVAESKGASVTSTDLGNKAIENLGLNKSLLESEIHIIHSDLFEKIPAIKFDFIMINPPYYPQKPESDGALAWYCGAQFEYFEKLFATLSPFMHPGTQTLMVLSEDCDLKRIQSIAQKNKFSMKEVSRKKFWWEWNYIFRVQQPSTSV